MRGSHVGKTLTGYKRGRPFPVLCRPLCASSLLHCCLRLLPAAYTPPSSAPLPSAFCVSHSAASLVVIPCHPLPPPMFSPRPPLNTRRLRWWTHCQHSSSPRPPCCTPPPPYCTPPPPHFPRAPSRFCAYLTAPGDVRGSHVGKTLTGYKRGRPLPVLPIMGRPLPVLPRIRPRLPRGTQRVTHDGMPRQTSTSTRAITVRIRDMPSQ